MRVGKRLSKGLARVRKPFSSAIDAQITMANGQTAKRLKLENLNFHAIEITALWSRQLFLILWDVTFGIFPLGQICFESASSFFT
jgi:hypothetical protein